MGRGEYREIDLVITVREGGYAAQNVYRNGKGSTDPDNAFGNINVKSCTDVKLRFTHVETGTNTPVVAPTFSYTFYDFDQGYKDAEVLHVVTPTDWGRQGMAAGSPFALAHTFAQTGPFRPANTVRGIDNVVLAGSSTVPGVGVPTAIMSGRLAADRITGVVAPRPTSEVNRS